MKKAFYFDVETTGLNPFKNDIIQIAALVEINGEIKGEFVSNVKPFDMENIHPKALETNGVTKSELIKYPEPNQVYKELITFLAKYVNKFDKNDKFAPIGYNVKFDIDFLNNFFKKNQDKYYGSWFSWRYVDPLAILYHMDYRRKIALADYKLSTVCHHFGIPIEAHEALSDIRATRELLYALDKIKL